jgi:hypothetical protein
LGPVRNGAALLVRTALLPVALLASCGGPDPPAPAVAAAAPSREGCEVLPGGSRGPVADPAGPYFHQVVLARTPDGVRLQGARQVLDHASVPDGVRLPDGTLRIYYVNGAEGSVWVARVDGETVTPVGPIVLDGVESPAGVVDPDATLMPDGRVRLAYLSGFGPPGSGRQRAMCLAESVDGVRFAVLGAAIRLADDTTTDPSLARLGDGTWLMALSRGQQTVMARSADGLRFESYSTLGFGGVPEVASLEDGRVRLYVCAGGIESYLSADAGRSWSREATVVAPGTGGKRIVCDPSLVAGAGVFLYKTADGLPPPAER